MRRKQQTQQTRLLEFQELGYFPGSPVVKNPPANAGDTGSILGPGRSHTPREDPTCHGATKPVHHNYWAHMLQLLNPVCLEPMLHNKRSRCNEKPMHLNEE